MKKTRLHKKRKVSSPLQLAKDEAWAVFSKCIRNRDNYKCYTCQSSGGLMNAGHFWHGVLDFDEENIHCQCVGCNHFKSGNLAVYASNLIRDMGIKKFKALEIRHHRDKMSGKKEIQYYLDIIEKYKL